MTTNINNPHDKFVKKILSDINLAKRFFKTRLSEDIQKQISLDTLKLQKGTFVDDNLKEHLTDLLYSAKIADTNGYVYLLFEHQSTPDSLMAFRLLKYSVSIMQQHLKNNKTTKLPLVYPVVYYTGKKPAKGFETDIMNCFEFPELAKKYFLKPFQLIDLQRMNDSELLADNVLAGFLMVMKHIQDKDMSKSLDNMLENNVFDRMHSFSSDYNFLVIKYAMIFGSNSQVKAFMNKLVKQIPEEGERMMTMAEQIEHWGIEKGIERVAINLLKSGESFEKVARCTGLSADAVRELAAKSVGLHSEA